MLPQESWAKDYASVASVVINVGEAALATFDKLEVDGVSLSAGLFRSCFEGMVVKADQVAVFREMELHRKSKYTASLLKEVANSIRDKRMWQWLIMHSALPEEKVHPSRSMFCLCLLAPLSCGGCLSFVVATPITGGK